MISRRLPAIGAGGVSCRPLELEEQLFEAVQRNQKLEQLNACFEAALNHMGRGLSMFDADQRLVVCNTAYSRTYMLPEELTRPGTAFADILSFHMKRVGECPSTDGIATWIKSHIAKLTMEGYREEIQNLKDGRVIRVTYQPLAGGGWVDMQEDITAQRQSDERVEWLARHDTLTEIPNRYHFRECLERQFECYDPRQGFALHWIDLDHFKEMNDRYGHQVGDGLLKSVAARLKSSLRAGDVVGRLGGDEFAILQVGVDREDMADNLARRLVQNIRRPHDVLGRWLHTDASIGVALAPQHGQDPEQLFASADTALYRAKSMGRGIQFVYSPASSGAPSANPLRAELEHALDRDEIVLHYHPIVDLHEERVSSFEALMRWKHPSRGMIPPSEFIPIAEESRLIVRMGTWALMRACADAKTWPSVDQGRGQSFGRANRMFRRVRGRHGRPPCHGARAAAPAARDHRVGAGARSRAHSGGAAQATRARRAHHPRRFRNVLCHAQLPAQLPLQEDQDRPQLRARHPRAPRLRRHREVGRRSGARAQHAVGGRGR